MMRIVVLLLVMISFKAFSQKLDVYVGFYNKKECNKKLRKNLHIHDSLIYNNGSVLIADYRDTTQIISIKLNFAIPDDKSPYEYCIREELTFSNDSCAAKYLKKLLHSKEYGWRTVKKNEYLASFKMHVKLNVGFEHQDKNRMTVVFTYIDKSTKEFKSMYNGLEKPE
jgi:hypothetical protein